LYERGLIIAASSAPEVLDVEKLAPGTIVVDDSLPPAVHLKRARMRMANKRDVLIAGGGGLSLGRMERRVEPGVVPEGVDLTAFLGEAVPGCRAESLLVAADTSLKPVRGLVDPATALRFWQLDLIAAPLHLGNEALPA